MINSYAKEIQNSKEYVTRSVLTEAMMREQLVAILQVMKKLF